MRKTKRLIPLGVLLLLLPAMLWAEPAFGHPPEPVRPKIKVLLLPRCHLCHDPFRPEDHLVLVPERELIRIEERGEFRIYIENTFDVPLPEVRLFVESPAFDIEIEPPVIRELKPGERMFFLVKLSLREGFRPGDYPLQIRVGAGQAELKPSIERVGVIVDEEIKPPPTEPKIDIPPMDERPSPAPVVTPDVNIPPVDRRPSPAVTITPDEGVEAQVEPAGEITVRVERFILAERYYLYLIPVILLISLLVWRKLKQR